MKLSIITTILFLFIGCKQKAQTYSYEREDSDEAYVMDSWSPEHKEDYYRKIGKLVSEFLIHEHYKAPSESEFNKIVNKNLKIPVNNTTYQIIPYHIFQKDSASGDASRLVLFPKERIISFDTEFPLLDTSSLKYYNSSDYKNLDHSEEYNIVLNKLLFTPNQEEIDKWLKDEQLNDLFFYLVCCFHFDSNEIIFRDVIGKIKSNPEKYSTEYLLLLFQKDKAIIDRDFISRIAKLDHDKKLLPYFRSVLVEEFNEKEQRKFEIELNEAYK
ncbi:MULTISPECIES: hypothetical protein [unclassified Chryseobacterium]|uniref:hypothetical protein n=1 Tax=unclassified Chryseobacterium TaxID=2593645 RepID=UPI000F464DCD|nr:hypothetical protein [Chryseobacterium sp. BIGb0232]MCS4305262.1 hypothetical protein [Chryseobacterium sp. BIGb0232]ROS07473.1 hypothetical protein EDF65_4859 [Chryseobacterium nakagawai]